MHKQNVREQVVDDYLFLPLVKEFRDVAFNRVQCSSLRRTLHTVESRRTLYTAEGNVAEVLTQRQKEVMIDNFFTNMQLIY